MCPRNEVVKATKFFYLNNTVAYAIAYALWSKFGRRELFGIDFSYKENMHFAEAGRACVEFWISKCMENDILVGMSGRSTVLDSNVPATEKLYGFHRLEKPLVAIPHEGKFIIGPYDEINKELEKQGLKINEDVAPPEPSKGTTLTDYLNYDQFQCLPQRIVATRQNFWQRKPPRKFVTFQTMHQSM